MKCEHKHFSIKLLRHWEQPENAVELHTCLNCGHKRRRKEDDTLSEWEPPPALVVNKEGPLKVEIEEPNQNEKRWHTLALIYGYNELAKVALTLGEKIYCSLIRGAYEGEYKKLGGKIEMQETEPSVITITHHMPHINLYARDIELMRKAVADFDAMKEKG